MGEKGGGECGSEKEKGKGWCVAVGRVRLGDSGGLVVGGMGCKVGVMWCIEE